MSNITRIYTIRDSKMEAYLQPFFAVNDAIAIRYIEQAMTDDQHAFRLYPEDYSLFDIGTFNDETAEVIPDPSSGRHVTRLIDIGPNGVPANAHNQQSQEQRPGTLRPNSLGQLATLDVPPE